MTEVCRLCLNDTAKSETPNDCTTPETLIKLLLPEIDLRVTPTFVVCNHCLYSLNSTYTFKNECLRVEQLINDHRKEFNAQFINLQEVKNRHFSDNCKEFISVSEVKIETVLDDCVENDEDVKNVDVLTVDPFQHLNDSYEIKNEYKIADKNDNEEICSDSQSFICEICSQSFQQSSTLETHLKTHAKQPEYACGICCKVFKQECQFTKHSFSHTDKERYYKCKVCNKGYKQRIALRLHEKIHKRTIGKRSLASAHLKDCQVKIHFGRHECETCGRKFGAKNALAQHVRTHTRSYKCKICGRNFAHRSSLNYHNKIEHIEHKPYVCEVCEKGFVQESHLKDHKKSHLNEEDREFFCSVDDCNRVFATASSLRKHLLRHTLPNDFECPYCKKRFIDATAVARHIKTHANEFECGTCQKTFKRKYSLERHFQTHRKLLDSLHCKVSF